MKRTVSKNQIFTKAWKFACVAVLASLVGVACQREGNGKSQEGTQNTISLKMVSGASQTNRIQSIDFKHQAKLPKREKLSYVATLKAPAGVAEYNWSATSVAIAPNNSVAEGRNIVYVTWHSDRQATNQATAWGGAIDVLNVLPGQAPEVKYTYMGIEGKSEVKFNHVLVSNGNLFVSGTSWKHGGTIARIPLNNGEPVATAKVECIGFPGSSVNAVAENNGNLVAISGYKGTYAEFAPNVEAKLYDYDHKVNNNVIAPATDSIVSDFGGKYVVSSNGRTYLLYCGEEHGMIQQIGAEAIELGKALTSTRKGAETYNEATGEWDVSTDLKTYYGKHTMAIKDNFAYVACGTSGLVGVNVETKAQVAENGIGTTGLCIDGDFLYAATGSGLRVYSILEDGSLNLYAYEVETYNETTGYPTSEEAATTGTQTRQSANYVAVDPNTGYIYVAYGQSGVRVYKLDKNEGVDMGDGIIWAHEDLPGYYSWGEIFTIEDEENYSLTSPSGQAYANNASYYVFAQSGKKKFSAENYRYFNGSLVFTKYKLDENGNSIDGKMQLEPDDDAAVMRLGNGWRLPTFEEAEVLIKNSDIKEGVKDGMAGFFLISKNNGARLFFPNGGYHDYLFGFLPMEGSTVNNYRWTSTLHTRSSKPGSNLFNKDGNMGWCYDIYAYTMQFYKRDNGELVKQLPPQKRPSGLQIRPVKDK